VKWQNNDHAVAEVVGISYGAYQIISSKDLRMRHVLSKFACLAANNRSNKELFIYG
jgi:hypothetical protein